MPIYEYCCQSCGRTFETLVMGRSTQVACPTCGAEEVFRVPSTFGIGGSAKGTGSAVSCGGCTKSSCAGCR